VQQDLGVTVDTFIELHISIRGIAKRDIVRHDERRFGAARDYQVAEVTIVRLLHWREK
jgi:hypothetical protein